MNRSTRSLLTVRRTTAAVALLGLTLWPATVRGQVNIAQSSREMMPALNASSATDTLHITVGRSMMLNAASPLRRVYVGNPNVLQTYTAGDAQLVLTAKDSGESSLVLWDESGAHRMYLVFADLDPEALRQSLQKAFPGVDIECETAEGRIVLTGTVDSQATADAAVKIASQYGKEVVNSMQVQPVHPKQVQLKLRIVEVDRSKLEQLGINIFSGGRTTVATTTGQFPGTAVTGNSSVSVSDPLNLFLYNAKIDLGITLRDLEQKQLLQVLAEPTISTMSGVPARFLSGGEFPFPVVQSGAGNSSAITIQFRPYGVKVEFTPVVNSDGSIHLKLAPEVSTLDYSNSVSVSGFTIPALSTRRAETDVELRSGQSFAVSGLLDHRTTESLSKLPGISDVPLLGQLFRTKSLNHSVLELVVVVTATVIDPLKDDTAKTATEPPFAVPDMDQQQFDQSLPGSFTKSDTTNGTAAPAARTK